MILIADHDMQFRDFFVRKGDRFEFNDKQAQLLIMAKRAHEAPKRKYMRRDMAATDTAEMAANE